MIPSVNLLTREISTAKYPNRTYKLALSYENNGVITIAQNNGIGRISGYADGIEAVLQAVYLILSTERYKHIIYSWDYGVELSDLDGKPIPYVIAELPRRIKEALTQDNRITDVINFEFEKQGKALYTKFTVVSNVGNITADMELAV
jgi:reverse gyrase